MKNISIQENKNLLIELREKYPILQETIENVSYIINFCGVQPQINYYYNGKKVILLWTITDVKRLSFIVSDSEIVKIKDYNNNENRISEFDMNRDQAIEYYKNNWHDQLFSRVE